jgi:crotonobetainyl-CoA:carnitine CoA-transferase CaiB-like acyl-CoA transferase
MAGALDGLRVIEVAGGAAAGYCGKLLADLGADVVKVEPPGVGDETRTLGPFPGDIPDPEASGLFLYLNANKRGVTLDLTRPRGRALLHGLLRDADLLVHATPPPAMTAHGLDWATVHELNPRLVECTIARFGAGGPLAGYHGHEITSASAGGWTTITGSPDFPESPPLKAFGQQADFQAGAHAAAVSLGVLIGRDLHGGTGQHIDLSVQEVVISMLEMAIIHHSYGGRVASRLGSKVLQPWAMLPAKDGYVFLLCVTDDEWRRFVEWMGTPEWTEWEIFADRAARAATWDVLRPLLEEWTMQHTVEEIYQGGLANKLAFAPISTMGDLLASDHLRARGFFATIAHPHAGELVYPGAPYQLSATPWVLRTPAPLLGQHTAAVLGLTPEHAADLKAAGIV